MKTPHRTSLAFALVAALATAYVGGTAIADAAAGDGPIAFTEEQVERGRTAYAQHCASCHGSALEGMAHFPELAGATFRGRWADRSVGELFTYVKTQMPLGAGNSLSAETYADLTVLLLARNGLPASDTPFDHEDDATLETPLAF